MNQKIQIVSGALKFCEVQQNQLIGFAYDEFMNRTFDRIISGQGLNVVGEVQAHVVHLEVTREVIGEVLGRRLRFSIQNEAGTFTDSDDLIQNLSISEASAIIGAIMNHLGNYKCSASKFTIVESTASWNHLMYTKILDLARWGTGTYGALGEFKIGTRTTMIRDLTEDQSVLRLYKGSL